MNDQEFMEAVQEFYRSQIARGKNKYAAIKAIEHFRSALRISIAKRSAIRHGLMKESES